MSNHDPKNIVRKLLQECLDVHAVREKTYGGVGNRNVFVDSAIIASAIIGKEITADEVATVLVAMKLARYGNARRQIAEILSKQIVDSEYLKYISESIWDSCKDAAVYMALTERERIKIQEE